jgi:hypothetical protein
MLQAQTWRQRKEARSQAKIERKKAKRQAKDEYVRQREEGPPFYLSNTLALYATPTAILNPYGAILPVGATYYFGKRFSASADASIPLFFNPIDIFSDDASSKKIKSDIGFHADIKWYLKIKHTRRLFAGLEGVFRVQDFTKRDASYQYHKTSAGIGAFFGAEFRLKPKWLLEGKVGVGLRNVSMKRNFDLKPSVPRSEDDINPSLPPGEDRIKDRATVIYVPLAFSIKYLIN